MLSWSDILPKAPGWGGREQARRGLGTVWLWGQGWMCGVRLGGGWDEGKVVAGEEQSLPPAPQCPSAPAGIEVPVGCGVRPALLYCKWRTAGEIGIVWEKIWRLKYPSVTDLRNTEGTVGPKEGTWRGGLREVCRDEGQRKFCTRGQIFGAVITKLCCPSLQGPAGAQLSLPRGTGRSCRALPGQLHRALDTAALPKPLDQPWEGPRLEPDGPEQAHPAWGGVGSCWLGGGCRGLL